MLFRSPLVERVRIARPPEVIDLLALRRNVGEGNHLDPQPLSDLGGIVSRGVYDDAHAAPLMMVSTDVLHPDHTIKAVDGLAEVIGHMPVSRSGPALGLVLGLDDSIAAVVPMIDDIDEVRRRIHEDVEIMAKEIRLDQGLLLGHRREFDDLLSHELVVND